MQGRDGETMPRMVSAEPLLSPSRVRWVALLVVASLLLAAGVGDSLAAKPSTRYQASLRAEHPAMPQVFKVVLRKGYVMYVLPNQHWQVVSTVFYRKDGGGFGVGRGVEYTVGSESAKGIADPWPDLSAKVEAGAVSAHFGPLGSIDVHFVPSGGSRQYRPYCGGEGVTVARGHYEGSIRFPGGDGHPSVEASVAQAAPRWVLQSRCTGGLVAEGPPSLPGAELIANSIQSDTPYFTAFKNAPNGRSRIGVFINEFRRGIGISRFVGAVASSSAFRYSPSLTTAKVRPPAPFSGVGSYDAERDRRHRWSGDLSVDFPGRENVSLTHAPLRGFINPARWIPPHPKKRG